MNGLLHFDQPVIGFLQFVRIVGIHGITQRLEGHHEDITGRVIDEGVAVQFRIQEDFPALFLYLGGINLRGVIAEYHVLPQVGSTVGVIRIEVETLHSVRNLIQVGDDFLVQGQDPLFLDQPVDHVIAGDHHVVGDAGLQLGIHFFRVAVQGVIDADAEFLFKVIDNLIIDVFAVVEHIQRSVRQREQRQARQADDEQGRDQFLRHFGVPPFGLFYL